MQDVQIHGITHRAPSAKIKKRWRVRWMVDGRAHDKVFATSDEANRYRSWLVAANHRGERFDRDSGEPFSRQPRSDPMQLHAWARCWVAEQWSEWQPRTRASAVEAMARFVPMVVAPSAAAPPEGLRRYLMDTFPPDSELSESDECERWLARWSFKLDELNRAILADVDRRLGLGKDGQALSGWTASRYRKLARACIRRALEPVASTSCSRAERSGRNRPHGALQRRRLLASSGLMSDDEIDVLARHLVGMAELDDGVLTDSIQFLVSRTDGVLVGLDQRIKTVDSLRR